MPAAEHALNRCIIKALINIVVMEIAPLFQEGA